MCALSYQLASWPDEEVLVGEILLHGEHVASVFRREDDFELAIYRRGESDLMLNMSDLESILAEIRTRLLS